MTIKKQDALLSPERCSAKYERRFATTMPLHSCGYVQYVLNDLQSPFRAPMRTDSNFAFAPPLVLQHIELLEFNRSGAGTSNFEKEEEEEEGGRRRSGVCSVQSMEVWAPLMIRLRLCSQTARCRTTTPSEGCWPCVC